MKNTKKIFIITFLILISGIVFSYSITLGNKRSGATKITNSQISGPSATVLTGKETYNKYCLSCHQSNGTGVPGMIPPLGTGSWSGKNPTDLISLILKGLNGEIEVDDEIYKNTMPPQLKITDQELAEVLTYVRSNFGNNFSPVTNDMVKKVRTAL